MCTLPVKSEFCNPKISVTDERIGIVGNTEINKNPVGVQGFVRVTQGNNEELERLHSETIIEKSRSSVTSLKPKKKKKYKSSAEGEPTHRRLRGFLLKRLKNPEILLAKVDLNAFEALTHICCRQVARAKKHLEEEDEDLVFRTVTLARERLTNIKTKNKHKFREGGGIPPSHFWRWDFQKLLHKEASSDSFSNESVEPTIS